ncbi:T9SS type A sorting domain-containing protein [Flavobacterium jejuense]|uniref:T9SS type A sorting domain-containing protein n=1 Tax=Flavobacterium jejuense TaxID=1544455 RepID=A0ABX0IU15_9FLAO|nr:T9SS type A sorting domain-containing protein [Flavobacterium jejuense]NHN25299.1 T9SS type A sorting domain-containing protein [Flavobacterium jejuense]
MKKITFLFASIIFSVVSTISAQTITFDWDTPAPTGVDASGLSATGTIIQTKNGITTMFAGTPIVAGIADFGGFGGSTGNTILPDAIGDATSATFTFSEPVNIVSILALDANGTNVDYTFTPTGGANSIVVGSLVGGTKTVNLNWIGVTSFTVTYSDAYAAFDNLIVIASALANTTFDWDTPDPTGVDPITLVSPTGEINQTKNGITTTLIGDPDLVTLLDLFGSFGSSGNIVVPYVGFGTITGGYTFAFSEPVNIVSIVAIERTGADIDYTFTPTGGSNSVVVESLVGGTKIVNLNWSDVTSFTVNHVGALPAFDNLIVTTSSLSTTTNVLAGVDIYPNPVQDYLYLRNVKNLESTKIYNNIGQLVSETKEEKIDFSYLNSGIYFLQITTGEGIGIKKIIKK